ncbi:peptidoglycan-binding protein [Streptomyces sp. NPDC004111]|uniref:peptidoglycan-binding domain-containing protein n=1 Tax=Streptomyces sp. NPDC004111 TaxID=3364690 RepID=UPI0036924798
MPDLTAPPAAVTTDTPASERTPAQDNRVFGKVARHRGNGSAGARPQDIELFDATLALPEAPSADARPAAETSRRVRVRRARRTGSARAHERERRTGLAMPLLITGTLAAVIGLSAGLTAVLDTSPRERNLAMPDVPPPSTSPDTELPAVPQAAASPPAASVAPVRPPAAAIARPTKSSAQPTARQPTAPQPAVRQPTASQPAAPPAHSPHPAGPARTDALQLGSTGPGVADLQRRLQQLQLYLGPADGTFTAPVEVALSRFQISRAIPERSGVYGPLTRAALHAETGRNLHTGRHEGQ